MASSKVMEIKNPKIKINLYSEFFVYSTNLQQPEKENFLELLLQKGILNAIEILLQSGYSSIRALGSELICQIVDLNQQPSIVRDHIMKTTNMRVRFSKKSKVGCVFSMVIFEFRMEHDDHR